MTAFNSKSGGFQLTTVGRVQTPTLAVLVEREEKIKAVVDATHPFAAAMTDRAARVCADLGLPELSLRRSDFRPYYPEIEHDPRATDLITALTPPEPVITLRSLETHR